MWKVNKTLMSLQVSEVRDNIKKMISKFSGTSDNDDDEVFLILKRVFVILNKIHLGVIYLLKSEINKNITSTSRLITVRVIVQTCSRTQARNAEGVLSAAVC